MNRIAYILLALALAISACAAGVNEPMNNDTPVSSDDPTAPPTRQPANLGDAGLSRENAYIESTELLTMESYPLQFMLSIQGNLPTPCHQLRVEVNPPDTENRVVVDVYSVTNPDAICMQVLQPFDTNVSLGSFPPGAYTLWVNGEMVAKFQS
jgi:hypothetical protein